MTSRPAAAIKRGASLSWRRWRICGVATQRLIGGNQAASFMAAYRGIGVTALA